MLQTGQTREAHLEDGLGLALGEKILAAFLRLVDFTLRSARSTHEGFEAGERQRQEGAARGIGVGALADRLHDQVDFGDRDPQSFHDLALDLGLPQFVARAPGHHVAPVGNEGLQRLLDVQDLGATLHDGEVDDAERRLQIGLPVQMVDDHLRDDVLLQLDDEADPIAIALVAHFTDAFQLLFPNEFGDARGHAGLVHLVRHLGDDDLLFFASPRRLLDPQAGAHAMIVPRPVR